MTTTTAPSPRAIRDGRNTFRQIVILQRMISALEDEFSGEEDSLARECLQCEVSRLESNVDELREDVLITVGPDFDRYL